MNPIAAKHIGRSHTIVTALADAGNAFIDAFSAERFREMIEAWQVEIDDYLARAGA